MKRSYPNRFEISGAAFGKPRDARRFLLLAFWFVPSSLLAAGELPVIWLEAGKENKFPAVYRGRQTDWSLRYEHRILDGGKIPDQTSEIQAAGYRRLFVKTPPLEPGRLLRATLYFGETPYRRAVVASPDPFEDRENWFRQHPIALYDPEKETAKLFDDEKIPFKHLGSFADIEAMDGAVIVVGRKTDFGRERGLSELLFKKSAGGGAVLVAEPGGDVPLDYPPAVRSLDLRTDAGSIFPLSSGRPVGAIWALWARGDRLVLATENIGNGGKAAGVGPTFFDIRFSGADAFEGGPRGRIVFDKELRLSRWKSGGRDVETPWYFKALIEELSKELNPKGR